MIQNYSKLIDNLNNEFKKLEQEILILNNFPSDKCIDETFNLTYRIENSLDKNSFSYDKFEIEFNEIKEKEIKRFKVFIESKKSEFNNFFDGIKELCPLDYLECYKDIKALYYSKIDSLNEEKLKVALEELSFIDEIFNETINIKFRKSAMDNIFENIITQSQRVKSYESYSYKELAFAAKKAGFNIRRICIKYTIYKNLNNDVLIIPQDGEDHNGLKKLLTKRIEPKYFEEKSTSNVVDF